MISIGIIIIIINSETIMTITKTSSDIILIILTLFKESSIAIYSNSLNNLSYNRIFSYVLLTLG